MLPRDGALPFLGAKVTKSANQAITAAGGNEDVSFDQEDYDYGGFHDNVTNNERFTIPAGVSWIQMDTSLEYDGSTASRRANFSKNGVAWTEGSPLTATGPIANHLESINLTSPPFEVVEGDYFTVRTNTDTDENITNGVGTYFAIWVLV